MGDTQSLPKRITFPQISYIMTLRHGEIEIKCSYCGVSVQMQEVEREIKTHECPEFYNQLEEY